MNVLEAIWKSKIAKDEAELNLLCLNVSKFTNLPRRKKLALPTRVWDSSNNFKADEKALKLMHVHLSNIQTYISSFEYNFTSEKYNEMRKDLGMKRIVTIARGIIKNSLPIRCVEATFVAAYLTSGVKGLTRVPVHFRSNLNGTIYRHIVLVIEYKNTFGALGLSRKNTLMDKPLKFKSLFEILENYRKSYEDCNHSLEYIAVGLPFSHSYWCLHPIRWRVLKLDLAVQSKDFQEKMCVEYWKKFEVIETELEMKKPIKVKWINEILNKIEIKV